MEDMHLSRQYFYQIYTEHARFAHAQKALQSDNIKWHSLFGTVTVLLLGLTIASCTVMKSPLIALGIIGAMLVIWFVFRYPWLALLLTFTGAGLPSLTVPLPSHTIRPVEAVTYLCLLLVFILRPPMQMKLPHILVLLFMALAVISFIHVPEISTNANVFGANKRLYDLTIIFLALFCGTFLFGYVKNVSSFLVTALLTNIPLYLISLAQAIGVKLPAILVLNQNPALTGDSGRLIGSFNGAATYGIYLTGLLALALSCWLLGTRRCHRIIGACMTSATVLAIVGSGTRSALLAMIIMFLVALPVTKHIKLLLGLFVPAFTGFAVFSNVILAHFTHAQTSTSNRLFLWNMAIKLIAYNPIIGIGLEQFHHYYNQLIISQSTQLNQYGISVHNQYIEWALEGGILWLILGVLLLISAVLLCGRAYPRADQEQRLILLTAILGVVAALVTSSLDVPFDNVEGGAFLCTLIGMALGSIIQQQNREKRTEGSGTRISEGGTRISEGGTRISGGGTRISEGGTRISEGGTSHAATARVFWGG